MNSTDSLSSRSLQKREISRCNCERMNEWPSEWKRVLKRHQQVPGGDQLWKQVDGGRKASEDFKKKKDGS